MIDYTRYSYKEKYEGMLAELEQLASEKRELDALFLEHIKKENAHNLTSKDIKLEKVKNVSTATTSDATSQGGRTSIRYATPLSHKMTIDFIFLNELRAHILNKNNPHNLTLEQMETISKMDILDLAALYYNRGEIVEFTYGLGGESLTDLYTRTRSNMDASQLLRDKLKPHNFVPGTPGPKSTVALSRNELLEFKDLTHSLPSNEIFVVTATPRYSSRSLPTPSQVATWMNTNYRPTNLPDGTIGAVRPISKWNHRHSSSNGTNWIVESNLTEVYILQVSNNRWVA